LRLLGGHLAVQSLRTEEKKKPARVTFGDSQGVAQRSVSGEQELSHNSIRREETKVETEKTTRAFAGKERRKKLGLRRRTPGRR